MGKANPKQLNNKSNNKTFVLLKSNFDNSLIKNSYFSHINSKGKSYSPLTAHSFKIIKTIYIFTISPQLPILPQNYLSSTLRIPSLSQPPANRVTRPISLDPHAARP